MFWLGRSPHGERGLKCFGLGLGDVLIDGRSPHGERGLKFPMGDGRRGDPGRSPHGERGLKSMNEETFYKYATSLSSRRAWIEISYEKL